MIGRDETVRFAKKGTDIYLFMDYNWISCDGSHSGSRNFLWGKAIFGKGVRNGELAAIREWTVKAYTDTVRNMVRELNLKNCAMAVTICGGDICVMTKLTNNRSRIKTCISPNDFYFQGYSAGNLTPYAISCDSPYELFYQSAMEGKKTYPNRKAVGIMIRQNNFSYQTDREKASESVRLCAERGMEVITIGLRDKSLIYEKPLTIDELKLLSTNHQNSVICDWEGLQEHLKKIAKEKGGCLDYRWEAMHAEDWHERMMFIDAGCLEGNAFCLNEAGKRDYFGIYYEYDYEFRISEGAPIQMADDKEDWECAESHFRKAAELGIAESLLFLGLICQVNTVKLRKEGKEAEASEQEIQAKEWLYKAEKKGSTPDRVSSTRFLGFPVCEIGECVQKDSKGYGSGTGKNKEKTHPSSIWRIIGMIIAGLLVFLFFVNR